MTNRSERDELLSYIGDAHKDAYGFRPVDWTTYCSMTIEELRNEAASLSDAVAATIAKEKEEQDFAIIKFESKIQGIIRVGAKDRTEAILWDRQAYDDIMVMEDVGYYLYINDLPYNYKL